MGLVKFSYDMLDDADEIVMQLTTTQMFGRRQPGAAA